MNETFSVIFKHREPLFSVITYVTPYFSKSGAHFVQNYDYHHLLLWVNRHLSRVFLDTKEWIFNLISTLKRLHFLCFVDVWTMLLKKRWTQLLSTSLMRKWWRKKDFRVQNYSKLSCFYELQSQSLNITEKVSINIASEASGQKLIKNAKSRQFWRVLENIKLAVKQCYQTSQFQKVKNLQKMPKFK